MRYENRLMGWIVATLALASLAKAQRVAGNLPYEASASAVLQRPISIQLDRVSVEQAVKAIAARASVRVSYQAQMLDVHGAPITIHATQRPLGAVLVDVLQGTGLRVVAIAPDLVSLKESASTGEFTIGIVTGTVTDAKTGQPLRGVVVEIVEPATSVNNSAVHSFSTTTEDNGAFRIAAVPAGSHTIRFKRLGYVRQTRTVTVEDGQAVTMSVTLEPSANQLDQVVVTGTIIPTELKAVPSAMTVVTAKDLEQRGITHIDQLFRGDIPGLFVINQGSASPLGNVFMFSRGGTQLDGGSSGYAGVNPIKTYVDGVELADPQYLNQIDPKSIERIEILSGPQASTIYGSGAINGVMQIFTKRGATTRPQMTLSLLSGVIQNNFSSALTPQHDYSAQLSGTEGNWSYNAGGSWNSVGHWTPAIQRTVTSGFGGGRLHLGPVTADVSVRLSTTLNHQRGQPVESSTAYVESGYYSRINGSGYAGPEVYTLQGQTFGLSIGYTAASWWSHELVLGTDASNTEERAEEARHNNQNDSLLFFSQSTDHRTSLRYTTTMMIPVTRWSQLTMSAGADGWHNLTGSLNTSSATLTGTLTGAPTIARQPGHNTGAFVQGQLGVWESLFLAYGLRMEWNPNYGAEAQPNYAPRMGLAYAHDFVTPWGSMTAKIRGSYGRATQPPSVGQKSANKGSNNSVFALYYGDYFDQLANPKLGPSSQQGGEGGVELYFGSRASLVVTRYNQTVNDLILPVAGIDSVRSLQPNPLYFVNQLDAAGYGYLWQNKNLNVANVRNQGWELQSMTAVGPLTAKGTYSWTKSRLIGVTPQYQSFFPPAFYAFYQPGTSFTFFPEHTWALGLTYGHRTTSVALNVTGVGQQTGAGTPLYYRSLWRAIRLTKDIAHINARFYTAALGGYTMADVNATHRLTDRIETVLQIQNATNFYQNDLDLQNATMGRQTKIGLHLRW